MFRSKVILSWTRVLTFKSRTLPRSFLLQKNRDQPLESKNWHQSKDLVQVLQRVTDLLERLGPEAHLRCWRTTVSWSSWRRLLLLNRTYESGDTWGRPDGPVKFGHWTSQCETSGPRLPQVFHVLLLRRRPLPVTWLQVCAASSAMFKLSLRVDQQQLSVVSDKLPNIL